jgi:hypothetical protein
MHSHHDHTSIPYSLWKCEFSGCGRSFKNRTGLKSHIRLVHSLRPEPSQHHPPLTPNTRHNLQPLTVPLSPSFPLFSPLSSSSSESESDLGISLLSLPSSSSSSGAGDHDDDDRKFKANENNDFAMHVDQTPSPTQSPCYASYCISASCANLYLYSAPICTTGPLLTAYRTHFGLSRYLDT